MKHVITLLIHLIFLILLCACNFNVIDNTASGSENNTKSEQKGEKYTTLADGTYLYKKFAVSSKNIIHLKDEDDNILLESSDIAFVSAKSSENNGYYIQFEFTEDGTVKFANATRENIGKMIYIVSNEQILSSPTIPAEITDGIAIINNFESYDELISYFNILVKD